MSNPLVDEFLSKVAADCVLFFVRLIDSHIKLLIELINSSND